MSEFNSEIVDQPEARRAMRLASYASLIFALILIVAKTSAWLARVSVAILSSFVNSLLDAIGSVVTLVAIQHSPQPADHEHRFGHGKVEALAALTQSAFIGSLAVILVFEAGAPASDPRPIEKGEIGIYVMLFSISLTISLVMFQRWAIAKSGSIAISADSLHSQGDLFLNTAVIAAILLVCTLGWLIADPILGAAIAFYILWSAYRIVRNSLDMLMDRKLPDTENEKIRQIALMHESVKAVHDLRTRQSGLTY